MHCVFFFNDQRKYKRAVCLYNGNNWCIIATLISWCICVGGLSFMCYIFFSFSCENFFFHDEFVTLITYIDYKIRFPSYTRMRNKKQKKSRFISFSWAPTSFTLSKFVLNKRISIRWYHQIVFCILFIRYFWLSVLFCQIFDYVTDVIIVKTNKALEWIIQYTSFYHLLHLWQNELFFFSNS